MPYFDPLAVKKSTQIGIREKKFLVGINEEVKKKNLWIMVMVWQGDYRF